MFKISCKSSTLIEVIVALVILTMFAAMFFTFIEKSKREINVEQKIQASILINTSISRTLSDTSFVNDTYSFGNLIIKKEIEKTRPNGLLQIKFSAFTIKERKILEKNIFVFTKKP